MRTKGWRSVFSFTFIQYVKTKSFIIGSIVICVIVAAICVLTNVLPGLIDKDLADATEIIGSVGDNTDNETDPFLESGALYLFDEAGVLADEDKSNLAELFPERFSEPGGGISDFTDELKSSEKQEIAVHVTRQTDKDGNITGYELRSYYTAAAKDSADLVGNIMT